MGLSYDLRGVPWLYDGPAAWVFVTLPKRHAREIREAVGDLRAFGSVPVVVTVGETTWKTSVFPDKGSGSYLLPLKATVRKAEGIEPGKPVTYMVRVARRDPGRQL